MYLSPDPVVGSCSFGTRIYSLLTTPVIDDTTVSKQRLAILMQAIATGQKVTGWDDGCATGIWAQSRPKIERLMLNAN